MCSSDLWDFIAKTLPIEMKSSKCLAKGENGKEKQKKREGEKANVKVLIFCLRFKMPNL